MRLPAYGYTFLGLAQRSGTGGSLQSEGTGDWAHWGRTLAQDFDHKSGVTPKISNYTKLGTGTVTHFTGKQPDLLVDRRDTNAECEQHRRRHIHHRERKGLPPDRAGGPHAPNVQALRRAWQARVRVRAYLSDGSAPASTDRVNGNVTLQAATLAGG